MAEQAMMLDELRITYDDGSHHDMKIKPIDMIRFERKFKMGAEKLEADPRLEYILFIAQAALIRIGLLKASDDFDAWAERIEEIGSPPVEEQTPLAPPSAG